VSYPMPSNEQRQMIIEQLVADQSPAVSEQSVSDPDVDRVLQLHAGGMSPTNIVYQIWGKSGSSFAERMAKVREILATAATATASKGSEIPLEGAVGA